MIYLAAILSFALGITASYEPTEQPKQDTVKEVYVWSFERDWREKYDLHKSNS